MYLDIGLTRPAVSEHRLYRYVNEVLDYINTAQNYIHTCVNDFKSFFLELFSNDKYKFSPFDVFACF